MSKMGLTRLRIAYFLLECLRENSFSLLFLLLETLFTTGLWTPSMFKAISATSSNLSPNLILLPHLPLTRTLDYIEPRVNSSQDELISELDSSLSYELTYSQIPQIRTLPLVSHYLSCHI